MLRSRLPASPPTFHICKKGLHGKRSARTDHRAVTRTAGRSGRVRHAVCSRLLAAAAARQASDLHLLPTADGLDVKWRLDGVLQSLGTFPAGTAANVVARIKVLADLLTYRTDIPQEGRIRLPELNGEMRVSTFPTLHGEKAVIRLFGNGAAYLYLADLGLRKRCVRVWPDCWAKRRGLCW